MEDIRILNGQKARNLVFTSAGDHANVHRWCRGQRNFDLWITYYGTQPGRYVELADIYNARQGGKFPNLHHIYQTRPDLLGNYKAIMVMDDDIIIDTDDLNRLFKVRQEYGLWVLQPAFLPSGRISLWITQAKPGMFLRFVSFVEVTCPLFKKDKLDRFMKVYDPVLVGWGIDWWFLDVLGPDLRGKVAIVDAIPCVNPHEATKGGRREIDALQPRSKRIEVWQEIARRYHIQSEQRGQVEYGYVPAAPA